MSDMESVRLYGWVDGREMGLAVRSRSGNQTVADGMPKPIEPGYWQVSFDVRTGKEWCECPGWHFRKTCWHCQEAKRYVLILAKRLNKKTMPTRQARANIEERILEKRR